MRKYACCDHHQISKWFQARNMSAPAPEFLPERGVIVDDTAAGFLIHTDANVGIIDFFISNPEKEKNAREMALSDIAHALIMTAKNLGLKRVVCNTKIGNVRDLASRHGFTYIGEYSSFSKEI